MQMTGIQTRARHHDKVSKPSSSANCRQYRRERCVGLSEKDPRVDCSSMLLLSGAIPDHVSARPDRRRGRPSCRGTTGGFLAMETVSCLH